MSDSEYETQLSSDDDEFDVSVSQKRYRYISDSENSENSIVDEDTGNSMLRESDDISDGNSIDRDRLVKLESSQLLDDDLNNGRISTSDSDSSSDQYKDSDRSTDVKNESSRMFDSQLKMDHQDHLESTSSDDDLENVIDNQEQSYFEIKQESSAIFNDDTANPHTKRESDSNDDFSEDADITDEDGQLIERKKRMFSGTNDFDENNEYSDSDDARSSEAKLKKRRTFHFDKPNIYQSSNLEIASRSRISYSKGSVSKFRGIKVDNSIVPKLKPEYERLNKYKQPTSITQHSFKSPDEILTQIYKFEPNELNYMSRDEIKQKIGMELPSEELINALHYYVADRIRKRLGIPDEDYDAKYTKFMNGSALLALGGLVDFWIRKENGTNTFRTYMEKVGVDCNEKVSKIDEFIRLYDDESSESETESESESDSRSGSDGSEDDDLESSGNEMDQSVVKSEASEVESE